MQQAALCPRRPVLAGKSPSQAMQGAVLLFLHPSTGMVRRHLAGGSTLVTEASTSSSLGPNFYREGGC